MRNYTEPWTMVTDFHRNGYKAVKKFKICDKNAYTLSLIHSQRDYICILDIQTMDINLYFD